MSMEEHSLSSDQQNGDGLVEIIRTTRRLFDYDMSCRPFKLLGITVNASGVSGVQAIGSGIIAVLITIISHRAQVLSENQENVIT